MKLNNLILPVLVAIVFASCSKKSIRVPEQALLLQKLKLMFLTEPIRCKEWISICLPTEPKPILKVLIYDSWWRLGKRR